ncbi:alpha/beta fold hydrolase [Aliiglaciecola sp. 2_MG-2023]|uniref:alpha/beta hydrolase n=1 Tax=unclassified Aliiglaciecola TaxID=2593648 RepID=UPI0026E4357E|nr:MULTISPECIES: alpha/beta fold hydrolase [unclassified Aliiglaciecola]MDO6709089.1 alpha/beta fold hydrolase [Aliiglaciecola sp. 2_MG-2023]MDO6750237.1 alpha/beta fold hydrolase [Aliiglaciecola sp. 1_MG-2023]
MSKLSLIVLGLSLFVVQISHAKSPDWLIPFKTFYAEELGTTADCKSPKPFVYKICSSALKNDGNGAYVYHHNQPTDTTVVLFHGLSDSPFFFESIAPAIHQLGYTVIVPLLPGHGKLDADDDMEDGDLAKRWTSHVDEVMAFAHILSPNVYIGGFSTGGALSAQHVLTHPDQQKGLILFSGALALDESVEGMAGIWGIKSLAKLLDWSYQTQGPNPYKYPEVSRHSAFMLTDIIFDVRDKLADGNILNLPIFSVHSEADATTPIRGVKDFIKQNAGQSETFFIDASYQVCHADLVVSESQLNDMQYDASKVDESESCKVPKANPKHAEMIAALIHFLNNNK